MSTLTQKLRGAARQLAPVTLGIVVASICLYQGRLERKYKHKRYKEGFPFSHYPMYSSFDDWEYVMFVADGEGAPLPLEKLTAYKANSLKKKFDDLIDYIKTPDGKGIRNRDLTPEQMRPAGEQVLDTLANVYPRLAERPVLRLYQVQITMENDAVKQSEPILIAERKSNPVAP